MSGAELITLGCRLNFAESEAMRAITADRDDLVIVNSCAVTAEAVRKTRQQIRKAKRARPDAEIVVTGCAVQTQPETFAAMPEVSQLLGNREKMLPESFASDRSLVSDIMAVRETAPHLVTGFSDRARAFVEVQNGCDHRCTFCVIPYGRGNSRSVPAGLVVERIKALVDEGFQEIVLTGVDVTSYGPDLPGNPSLGLLVERILKGVPALPRLRLSSLDSIEIDERLFEIITGEPRFMPHLHLSLQAGDDMILKRMKRRHSRTQSVEMVAKLKDKRPEIAIGADIIAGFPTETDEMAANTLALVEDCQIVFGHIFPYSARRGTPAAKMPQVPVPDRKARAQRLREAAARQKSNWLRGLVGTRQRVLVERDDGVGHAENFAEVRIRHRDGSAARPVQLVDARLSAIEQGILIGEVS
ncbi:tRNA (N(6)-L-threonylcarbamoyladenosine(37)-C(2))-methylthiotransferase MtaB [Parasphingopyxis lamellibrachiae]|uniref:Threonylcarbamoyladenosine tRNA methylthiotransferase MtaB n=1 Tax=Parasphingopyxis lamellibrachiae TaxID=680125 RepID=A0A3D9FCD3_9SPHN|nr:tRNA (N(6)-L-threonylcarbamoyladenosine(37)-C(2))-methylthiotransferase MtaB [Parasphingopyxis lamellibrachiae]RED15470.1 threonylcarbamoyladenosine tRNA methylthiotransferase MtaB [Parasphingopyxis lamellibrachiae]